MRLRHLTIGLLGLGLFSLSTHATLTVNSSGIWGYSGNPATNNGQTCNTCHSGGRVPDVFLNGPAMVEKGSTASYTLQVRNGQRVAAGLDVSVTGGALVATDPDTQILQGELTHTQPWPVDANGWVTFPFDWTAPGASGSETMYGAGNSVNRNFQNSGDRAAARTLTIQVVDCMVKFSQYGAGTAGSGGLVPDLSGSDNQCAGGYTVDLANGLGGGRGFLWLSGSAANLPFACGNILVNLGDPLFTSLGIKLGGTPGLPGAGSFSAPGPDVSALAGLDVYLQALLFDPSACRGVALSNGLLMDIG